MVESRNLFTPCAAATTYYKMPRGGACCTPLPWIREGQCKKGGQATKSRRTTQEGYARVVSDPLIGNGHDRRCAIRRMMRCHECYSTYTSHLSHLYSTPPLRPKLLAGIVERIDRFIYHCCIGRLYHCFIYRSLLGSFSLLRLR